MNVVTPTARQVTQRKTLCLSPNPTRAGSRQGLKMELLAMPAGSTASVKEGIILIV